MAGQGALAVRPAIWTETPSGLVRGEAEGVALTGQGAIVLAPRRETLAGPEPPEGAGVEAESSQSAILEPIIWSTAIDSRGHFVLGTGHSGRLLQVDAKGRVATLAHLPEPEVTAVLSGRGGELFAATSPNGALYSLREGGDVRVLAEMEERYIWALAQDGAGNLYVGTGERGRIYRISPEGESSLFYDSREPHITALRIERGGSLIAGSDGSGRIYRIDELGAASVVHESRFREIADLALGQDGEIYAAAVAAGVGEIPPPAPRLIVRPPDADDGRVPARDEVGAADVAGRGREREGLEAEIEGVPTAAPARRAREGGGAILRIAAGGAVEEVWRSSEDVPYALATGPEGRVYAGIGEPARLLRLEEKGKASALARFPQGQITGLQIDPLGQLMVATSNAAATYRISRQTESSGHYLSPIRDAGAGARWGRVRWEATLYRGGLIEIQTRTGDAALPDDTWSDWSTPYDDPEGSEITSPSARYIQWRARLSGSQSERTSPSLRSVTVSYLPRNRPPRVRELAMLSRKEGLSSASTATVTAPAPDGPSGGDGGDSPPEPRDDQDPASPRTSSGEAAQDTDRPPAHPAEASEAVPPATTPPAAKAAPTPRPRIIVWHAEDPDEDQLTFRIFLQREPSAEWALLAANLADSSLTFDEGTWPEGRYRVKVVASDAPSNYTGEALEAETVVEGALIDLSPPRLETIRSGGRGSTVQVRATDTLSPIESAEILSGSRTVAAARPLDGVLDSRVEVLEIDTAVGLTDHPPLRLRVRDSAGNEATLDLAP